VVIAIIVSIIERKKAKKDREILEMKLREAIILLEKMEKIY